MNNNDALKHLENAYNISDRISVTGNNVEMLVAIRQELRAAYASIKEKENKSKNEVA